MSSLPDSDDQLTIEREDMTPRRPTPSAAGAGIARRKFLRRAAEVTLGAFVIAPTVVAGYLEYQRRAARAELSNTQEGIARARFNLANRFLTGYNQIALTSGFYVEGSPLPTERQTRAAQTVANEIAANAQLQGDALGAFGYSLWRLAQLRDTQKGGGGPADFSAEEFMLAAGLSATEDSSRTKPTLGDTLAYLQTTQDYLRTISRNAGLLGEGNEDTGDFVVATTLRLAAQTGVSGEILDGFYNVDPGATPAQQTGQRLKSVPLVLTAPLQTVADVVLSETTTVAG